MLNYLTDCLLGLWMYALQHVPLLLVHIKMLSFISLVQQRTERFDRDVHEQKSTTLFMILLLIMFHVEIIEKLFNSPSCIFFKSYPA